MSLALFVLRAVIGLLFMGHGAQKLFGRFGGHGIEGTAGFFESIGMRPGRPNAIAAGAAELIGGALLVLGLLTPFAAAALIAVMTTAIITVHFSNGLWVTDQGMEYNLVLIAAAVALAGAGPGSWSLDSLMGLGLSGTGWALAALGAGMLGGAGAVLAGRLYVQREQRGPRTHGHGPHATPA
ncbi:MAG: putative oxidoreductase [Solirubrobacterales bacterium]|jgi:putative oxidoreductase|nr:putative oxidoreductase [Solirubrobacterales bacterium]